VDRSKLYSIIDEMKSQAGPATTSAEKSAKPAKTSRLAKKQLR